MIQSSYKYYKLIDFDYSPNSSSLLKNIIYAHVIPYDSSDNVLYLNILYYHELR